MSVSLDGYVAPPDGSSDWVAAGRSQDGAAWTLETVSGAGTHLIGAATYALWATFWPGESGPFAKPMNEIPKVVFSTRLQSADSPETTIASGDLAEAVTRLKQERSGGYLLAQGGARFARSLVATGLIDEYRLVVTRSSWARASGCSTRRSRSSRSARRPSAAEPSRTSSRRARHRGRASIPSPRFGHRRPIAGRRSRAAVPQCGSAGFTLMRERLCLAFHSIRR